MPAAARGQTTVSPRWDTAVMAGLFVGHPAHLDTSDSNFDQWYNDATLAISAARYLTPHLKAEGEVMWSGEGRRYVQRLVPVPGLPGVVQPVGSEHLVRTNSVAAGLAWQFLDNQWAHPFVFGGVAVDFDRERIETWPQSYFRGDPRVPGNEIPLTQHRVEDLGTTHRVRAVLGTGAKLYMTPRVFFKTDARVHVGGESSGHVSFRLGFGVDF
jgi:hypothetical protein